MKENARAKRVSARAKRYDAEFKRGAVEMVLHGGKALAQVARELGISEPTLHNWKRAALEGMESIDVDGTNCSPKELAKKVREQQKEIEYLQRQREILKKAISILGENPSARML